MAPERNSSDAGGASKPKRSCDVLYISEKVKILDMIEIEKKLMREIAQLYGKNKKYNFYCLCSALKEKHDFYCSIIPRNCTVQVLYFFIALSSLEV